MPLTPEQRLPRFGMHPTSHLAHHEEQSFAASMHLHGVPVGDRLLALDDAQVESAFGRLFELLHQP